MGRERDFQLADAGVEEKPALLGGEAWLEHGRAIIVIPIPEILPVHCILVVLEELIDLAVEIRPRREIGRAHV